MCLIFSAGLLVVLERSDIDTFAVTFVGVDGHPLIEPCGEIAGSVGRIAFIEIGVDHGKDISAIEISCIYTPFTLGLGGLLFHIEDTAVIT